MTETIVVEPSEEVFVLTQEQESFDIDVGDVSFTLTDATETFNVTIEQPSVEEFTLEEVVETFELSSGEEIIESPSVEETLDFSPTEPVVYVKTTNNFTEEDLAIPYNTQVDFVGETTIYKGWAAPGTSTSLAAWRIQKLEFVGSDDDVIITWADGNGLFDNVWDNHLSLTYS